MKYLPNLLIVVGVCVGALGASGFHTPHAAAGEAATREPFALPLFLLGSLSLGVGGILVRQGRRQGRRMGAKGDEGGLAEKQAFVQDIAAIRNVVVELDEQRASLSPTEIRARIGRLMADEFFDLTSKSDALIQLLGFSGYARVWEGVAICERLLNRCWSMLTDGYPEEGLAELPLARASIEQAAREIEST